MAKGTPVRTIDGGDTDHTSLGLTSCRVLVVRRLIFSGGNGIAILCFDVFLVLARSFILNTPFLRNAFRKPG